MGLEFEDNRAKVKDAMFEACEAFLYEAGGELEAQVKRNTKVVTGKTKGSWRYFVRGSYMAEEQYCQVGSDYENALWEEFGTGEYALHGDGRKGGWFYEDATGVGHFTRGKHPKRPLHNAFTSTKSKLIKRLSQLLSSHLGGR